MAETLKLPLLAAVQTAPQGAARNALEAADEAADGGSPPSFADMLGALSAMPPPAIPVDEIAAQVASDGQELPLPAANLVTPEFAALPQLIAASLVPTTAATLPPELRPTPAAAAVASTLQAQESAPANSIAAADLLPHTEDSKAFAATLAALRDPRAATPAVPQAAVAVVPAPTFVAPGQGLAGRNPARGADAALPADRLRAAAPTDPAKRPAPVVTVAALADSARPNELRAALDPAMELRPMFERPLEPAPGMTAQPLPTMPPPSSTEPTQLRMTTAFAQAGWSGEVEQKLTWVVTNARQEADLVLNPPQLGRIEVTLVMEGDKINASFSSPHQAVREALEESLARLRETLADAGISLGQTHVGRESSRDAPFMETGASRRPGGGQGQTHGDELQAAALIGSQFQTQRSRGMVDVFA